MKIVFNGREYGGVDQMPPEVRRDYDRTMALLADRDADGMPDVLDFEGIRATAREVTTTRFFVDGKGYTDPDRMPPEARRAYERLVGELGRPGSRGLAEAGAAGETAGVSRELVQRLVVSASRPEASEAWLRAHVLASPRRSFPLVLAVGAAALLFALFLLTG